MLLAEQDRTRWDAAMIAEGLDLVRRCLRRPARAATKSRPRSTPCTRPRPTAADTDWRQIVALYDQLAALDPGPVVALNRAVALAEVEGPAAALAVVDDLDLPHHHLLDAVRADLLTRLGRTAEARTALEAATAGTQNPGEQALLARRLDALTATPAADG